MNDFTATDSQGNRSRRDGQLPAKVVQVTKEYQLTGSSSNPHTARRWEDFSPDVCVFAEICEDSVWCGITVEYLIRKEGYLIPQKKA